MKIDIDLETRSVTYEDIGSQPRARRVVRRKGPRGPRIKRLQPQDQLSKLRRQRTNLRVGIKKRLDSIKFRTVDPKRVGKVRQEIRSMFVEFKRVDVRYQNLKKRGLDKPQRTRTRTGKKRN